MLPYLVVTVVIGGLLLLVFYLIRQEWQVTDKLAEFAAQRGWSLQEHPDVGRAFVLRGGDPERRWEIELYRSSRHQPALTTWKSTAIDWTATPVLIGAQIAGLFAPDADEGLTAGQLDRLGGELFTRTSGWGALPTPGPWGLLRHGIEPGDLTLQSAGSEEFRRIFSVLSGSLPAAQRLLSNSVERQLLAWPDMTTRMDAPLVIANQEGLSVRLPHDKAIKQTDLLESLEELGLALEEAAWN